MSEDKLREEAKRLMEDKEKYQIAAKDNLKNLGRLDRQIGRQMNIQIIDGLIGR